MQIIQMKRPKIEKYGFKIDWPINSNLFLLMIEWIMANISSPLKQEWQIRSTDNGFNIYFKNKIDAIAFKLRWL